MIKIYLRRKKARHDNTNVRMSFTLMGETAYGTGKELQIDILKSKLALKLGSYVHEHLFY